MAVYPYTQPYYQRGAPQYPATVNAASRMPDTGGLLTSTTSSPGFASGGTAPTGISQSTSIGFGGSGRDIYGGLVPDLSYAGPEFGALLQDYINLAPTGSGFVPKEQLYNANSPYTKFGYNDPESNRQALAFYNYLGSLPTRRGGGFGGLGFSPALNQLQGATGQYGGPPGPTLSSISQRLFGTPFSGAWWATGIGGPVTSRDVGMYGAYNPYPSFGG